MPPLRVTSRDRSSAGFKLGAALTTAFNEARRRAYRWSRLNRGKPARLEQMRKRVAELASNSIGVRLSEIDPELEREVAPERVPGRELELGQFDHDGGILMRAGPRPAFPSITPEQFLPRAGYQLKLIDVDGRLAVRKEFGSRLGQFLLELEALVRLGERGCPVPRLIGVDWRHRAILLEYLPGPVLRESLSVAGVRFRKRDRNAANDLSPYSSKLAAARALLPEVMTDAQIAQIGSGLEQIHSAGYVLEDVKYGNIIIHQITGEPMFIDFERALPLPPRSPGLAGYLRHIDLAKFRDHFGQEAYVDRSCRDRH